MHNSEFDASIKRLEDAFDNSFAEGQVKILWERMRKWDSDTFGRVVESMIELEDRLPPISKFFKAATRLREDGSFNVDQAMYMSCGDCRGGVRYWIRQRDEWKTERAVCRCSCEAGNLRWAFYPPMDEVERREDFVRFDSWSDVVRGGDEEKRGGKEDA